MTLFNGETIKNEISYARIWGEMMYIYILLAIENYFAIVHR